ncbi:MAG: ABC transporter substrate-binding protein [Rhodospirillaceae bacterium]|nr:ABC transporter substrate-binding protein [Rhodospirillaceae bacterium]
MLRRDFLRAGSAVALTLGVPWGRGRVWAAETPKQGGQMIVTFQTDLSTLDPAVGYDWQNWSVIKVIFDGLMDYKAGTTELVPDLAESFNIAPDGLKYTFRLRKDVKFHNGRLLTAADIKYSFERMLDPATQSPGAGFYDVIKGQDAVVGGQTNDLAGLTTPDDHTVVFELVRPDATFLHKLALNFPFAVPKEEVEKYGPDFATHPVGTGAFKVTEWTLGQRLVLERNPNRPAGQPPYLDRIIFEFGQEPTVALLRLQRGEVDILGDSIPPAQFNQVMADPANKDLIVQGNQFQTGYVTMLVTKPPFDQKEVRQAVNMAINKERIVRIINGRAKPANQPLPPGMPGYDPNYKGYPYDVDGAKKLLAAAGYADGFDTELYCMNVDPNPRIAQAIQQDLAAIGIRAEIKSLAQSAVIEAGGQGNAPMIWSGGMAWISDYPDPSDFYGPILGCGGAVPGGWNWAKYCNEAIDKRAAEADAIVDPAKAAERVEMWRKIFLDIMEDAPWAPIFNELRFTMHSARIGGDRTLFVDPVYVPLRYDYIYAKDA